MRQQIRGEIDLRGRRALLIGIDERLSSGVFGEAESYRCDSVEGPHVDLIAEPSDLVSVPDECFEIVAVDGSLADRADFDAALGEMCRVLEPGGWLLVAPGKDRPFERIERQTSPSRTTPTSPGLGFVAGYPYHLSRKTGRRIVFCLDGPLSPGDRLTVETVNGETVGSVAVGPYRGGRGMPSEPWRNGMGFPPRAAYELDSSHPSGVYRLNQTIPFVQRHDGPASITVLVPSHTATAFNRIGGEELLCAEGRCQGRRCALLPSTVADEQVNVV